MNRRIVIATIGLLTICLSVLLSYLILFQIKPQIKIIYANDQYLGNKFQYIRDHNGDNGYKNVSATGNFIMKNNKISTDCRDQNKVLNQNNVPFEEEEKLPPYILNSYINGYQCPESFGRGELYIYDSKTKISQPLHYPTDTQSLAINKINSSDSDYRIEHDNYLDNENFYLENKDTKIKIDVLKQNATIRGNYGVIVLGWLNQ